MNFSSRKVRPGGILQDCSRVSFSWGLLIHELYEFQMSVPTVAVVFSVILFISRFETIPTIESQLKTDPGLNE